MTCCNAGTHEAAGALVDMVLANPYHFDACEVLAPACIQIAEASLGSSLLPGKCLLSLHRLHPCALQHGMQALSCLYQVSCQAQVREGQGRKEEYKRTDMKGGQHGMLFGTQHSRMYSTCCLPAHVYMHNQVDCMQLHDLPSSASSVHEPCFSYTLLQGAAPTTAQSSVSHSKLMNSTKAVSCSRLIGVQHKKVAI